MIKLGDSFFVGCGRREAFEFISDPANIARLPGGTAAGWTSGPPHGVGSTFAFEALFLGLRLKTRGEITIWKPPERYGRKIKSGSLTAAFAFTFEEVEQGTRITAEGELVFQGVMGVLERPLRGMVKKRSQEEIAALKKLLNEQCRK